MGEIIQVSRVTREQFKKLEECVVAAMSEPGIEYGENCDEQLGFDKCRQDTMDLLDRLRKVAAENGEISGHTFDIELCNLKFLGLFEAETVKLKKEDPNYEKLLAKADGYATCHFQVIKGVQDWFIHYM